MKFIGKCLLTFVQVFVTMSLFNWFVVPTFHVPQINWFVMFGITMFFAALGINDTLKIDAIIKKLDIKKREDFVGYIGYSVGYGVIWLIGYATQYLAYSF